MAGEILLIGIAQIAVVIAGFTAITAALTPAGGAWGAIDRLRQRAIVTTSFNVVFEALLPVIVFAALDDARSALVIASGLVAVYTGVVITIRGRQLTRAGGLRTRSAQLLFVLGPLACILFAANAVLFASVAVYAVALCTQLMVAVIAFYSLVSSATS